MFPKDKKSHIGYFRKAIFLMQLIRGGDLGSIIDPLNAHQLQELRNFLEDQIIYLSNKRDLNPLTLAEIKTNLEPIPNYYWAQDCREPLEACFNETCLTSNSQCFSKKMKQQINALIKILKPYLSPQLVSNKEEQEK
ncbi:MAG: hypothetical protein D6748_04195 [Calditrichaeota bacterium]|nr:MAG: hypothetical protein D6748_04195 [Calditrichota bacterium]